MNSAVYDKPSKTFNDVSFIFDLVEFIVNAFLDRLVIVDNVLSHTQVITDDCLSPVVDQ